MKHLEEIAEEFFARYARALLDRDAETIADMYAVPGLIAFPDQTIAVSGRSQTRDQFANNWDAYENVNEADPRVVIAAQTGHSLWTDVTWSYNGRPQERYMYQLLRGPSGWQIGVLTPMELAASD